MCNIVFTYEENVLIAGKKSKGEKSKEGMKKVRVLKRSILSLLLSLSLVISPLAGTGLVVSAEEDGGGHSG